GASVAVVPGSSSEGAAGVGPAGTVGVGGSPGVGAVAGDSRASQRVATISFAGRSAAASEATGSVRVVRVPAVGGVDRFGEPNVTPSPARVGSKIGRASSGRRTAPP